MKVLTQVHGRAADLKVALERRPFVAFRIHTEGGAAFEVRRPELLSVCGTHILLARGNPVLGTDRVLIDAAHVTRIESDPTAPEQ